MDELATVLLKLGAGLGAFLLGMRHLSEGLQAASGEGLRRFMSFATGRRAAGVATGFASTLVVQSSSIIVVMLVGFVTSGLMTLAESVNVLVGANVGTTLTIWLMAFAPSPDILGLAVLTVGALLYFPFRAGRLHDVGLALMGLGLVFIGMHYMKLGVAPIRESPRLSAALRSLAAVDFATVCFVALASALFTAVIQSSAASILIFMTLASEGVITYETAVAALFGANIGTTATGWLAAMGGSRAAKRVAAAHTLTNLAGSLILLPLVLPVFVPLGRALFPATRVMVPIAFTDTLFAVLRGALTLPFVAPFTRLLERLIPNRSDEQPHLSALSGRIAVSPVLALVQASREIAFMAESIDDLLAHVRSVLTGEDAERAERHVYRREEILDNVQKEVTVFIGKLLEKRLTPALADHAGRLVRLADEYESASDEARAIVKAWRRGGATLSETDLALVLDIHDRLADFRLADSAEIKSRIAAVRQTKIAAIGYGANVESSIAALDMLTAYDHLRLCLASIAETRA